MEYMVEPNANRYNFVSGSVVGGSLGSQIRVLSMACPSNSPNRDPAKSQSWRFEMLVGKQVVGVEIAMEDVFVVDKDDCFGGLFHQLPS